MKYYIVVNKEQKGPYEYEELARIGLNCNTPVWRQGMPQWAIASQLPELKALLNDNMAMPPQIPAELLDASAAPAAPAKVQTPKIKSAWWSIIAILSIIASMVGIGLSISVLEADFYYQGLNGIYIFKYWLSSQVNGALGCGGGALLFAIWATICNRVKTLNVIAWILMALTVTLAAITAMAYFSA